MARDFMVLATTKITDRNVLRQRLPSSRKRNGGKLKIRC
eukprot:SAG31_NODE_43185_length_268_cov_0.615385_1_plen_38_part_01